MNPLDVLDRLAHSGDVTACEGSAYGPTFLVNRPEYIAHVLHSANYQRAGLLRMAIGNGLAASEGEYWKQQRRTMQPAFLQRRTHRFAGVIVRETRQMMAEWKSHEQADHPLELTRALGRLTLRIVLQAFFSSNLDIDFHKTLDAVQTLIEYIGDIAGTLFGGEMHFSPARNNAFRQAIETIDLVAEALIHERQRFPNQPKDLLSFLMSSHHEGQGKRLDSQQLRDEIVTMLIAGHENTSLMLTWAFYLLWRNPPVAEALHREVHSTLGGRPPTEADLSRMPLALAVLKESLRLFPPIWQISRKALHPTELGGRRIPAEAAVVVSPYTMHRHPKYWTDPMDFNPARFLDPTGPQRHRFSFFPFGGGPHNCIGGDFALFEGQLILSCIMQQYHVDGVDGRCLEPRATLTLRPQDGFRVVLRPRQDYPQ